LLVRKQFIMKNFYVYSLLIFLSLSWCNGQTGTCDYPYNSTCNGCVEFGTYPDCFIKDPATGHLYLLANELVSWETAYANSNSKYSGNLASISSQAEHSFIQSAFGGSNFWVAGTDYNRLGTWSWVTGEEIHKVFYTVRGGSTAGSYNNFSPQSAPTTNEIKSVLVNTSGVWTPQYNYVYARYLVEIAPFTPPNPRMTYAFNPSNGHYYQYVQSEGITWFEANDRASGSKYKGFNGYLVTINTPEEHNFLLQNFMHYDNAIYIGASDAASEGTWKWLNENTIFYSGSNCVGFCLWGYDEPNGYYSENYAYWRFFSTWRRDIGWVDYRINPDVYGFIVEYS